MGFGKFASIMIWSEILLIMLCSVMLSEILCFVLLGFEFEDAEKGLALAPFLNKFSSIKMVGKKGSVPLIDYKLLEKATDNFQDSNILGVGGFGCVYKAKLDDNLLVAVKKLNCESQDAEREFEVMFVFDSYGLFGFAISKRII